MKINKERAKQIILTCIAFLLIFAGYFNFNMDNNHNKSIEVSSDTNDVNIGDVQLVSTEPVNEGCVVSNDELLENENLNEEKKEEPNDNYFEETKIERDRMYSEMLETYQKIINSSDTPADQRAIAAQEISNITKTKNGIMIAENLIKNKGFENVVILINNDTVSVIVKSPNLNKEQISKIQNITQRELGVKIANVNISNKI